MRSQSGKLVLTFAATFVVSGCGGAIDKAIVEGAATLNGKKILNLATSGLFPRGNNGGRRNCSDRRWSLSHFEQGGRANRNASGGPPCFYRRGDWGGGRRFRRRLADSQSTSRATAVLPTYRFEGREQFLPPPYNSQPGLTIEVTGETNPQIEDFNLRGDAT